MTPHGLMVLVMGTVLTAVELSAAAHLVVAVTAAVTAAVQDRSLQHHLRDSRLQCIVLRN
jgi:type III secretory pathway component EscS